MNGTQWWISSDMIGAPGSPKIAGPFSTRDDALTARQGMERLCGNYSVFEEPLPDYTVPRAALEKLRKQYESREGCDEVKCGSHKDIGRFLAAVKVSS